MMKQLILLIIVLALLLLVADNERTTVQVTIVVPPELVPYFEWLVRFPGWHPPKDEPPNYNPAGLQARNKASPSNHIAVMSL